MTDIKKNVMTRVHAVHAMRPFVSTAALSVLLVLVSLYAVSREVWVAMIFRNMPSPAHVAEFANFFASAFLHTTFVVQAFSVIALISAAWFVADGIRSLTLATSRA